jgi:hypothetical protein
MMTNELVKLVCARPCFTDKLSGVGRERKAVLLLKRLCRHIYVAVQQIHLVQNHHRCSARRTPASVT